MARSNLILMVASGQVEDAIDEYLALVDMYYNMADLNNVQQSINDAMQLAQQHNANRQIRLKILRRQAEIEMQSLNWRQAQHTYEQIRSLQPEDEPTRLALIDLQFRLDQDKKAGAEIANYINYLMERRMSAKVTALIEKLSQTYPQQPIILRQYADLLRQAGRRDEAIQKLDQAGELYLQKGDRAAAQETVMAILAMNPPNAAQYQQLLAQLKS
jgi:tetratricopeptide (TPR) repeat protein